MNIEHFVKIVLVQIILECTFFNKNTIDIMLMLHYYIYNNKSIIANVTLNLTKIIHIYL